MVSFKSEIDAEVVVTARLAADGTFEAKVSGTAQYALGELPGATASASVPVPKELADIILAAMVEAQTAVESALGKALQRSCADAYRVSVVEREIH